MKTFLTNITGENASEALVGFTLTEADINRIKQTRDMLAPNGFTEIHLAIHTIEGNIYLLSPVEPEDAEDELIDLIALGSSEGTEATPEDIKAMNSYENEEKISFFALIVTEDSISFTLAPKYGGEEWGTQRITISDFIPLGE